VREREKEREKEKNLNANRLGKSSFMLDIVTVEGYANNGAVLWLAYWDSVPPSR